ncbi:MAG: hypothetical protein A07HB70_00949 [uncultured archaeon A07HB70]|nr:MAG: hypothetical protein A07HB70_00949 [uncultured archaeon A07HB70]
MFVVQHAEPPSSSVKDDGDGWAALHLGGHPAGVKSGAKTTGYLVREGVVVRSRQIDPDGHLIGWGDLAPVSGGYRGENPLGRHGDSENRVVKDGHRHKTPCDALTCLLVDANERRADVPARTTRASEASRNSVDRRT